jgi:hypothetical protein
VKYFYINIIVFIIAGTVSSCEKVIHLNLAGTEKKYVIEGQITDNSNSVRVNLSQTFDVSDSNQFTGVETAKISITEGNRPPVELTNTGGGVYRANMTGQYGKTYTLTVKVDGQIFTSVSTMPKKVPFDTLYVSERLFLGKTIKLATVEFHDPPGLGNAYRFIQYIDGEKENNIFILDDKLVDGRKVIYDMMIYDNNYTLKPEDQLRVEMRCIDRTAYDFWYSLTQSSLGQNQSASPGNPVTNIRGGALGYFSAQTFEAKNIAVME